MRRAGSAAAGRPAPLGSARLGGAGSRGPRTAIYRRRGGHARRHAHCPQAPPTATPPACGAEAKPPEGAGLRVVAASCLRVVPSHQKVPPERHKTSPSPPKKYIGHPRSRCVTQQATNLFGLRRSC